jgi:hypothetical protein
LVKCGCSDRVDLLIYLWGAAKGLGVPVSCDLARARRKRGLSGDWGRLARREGKVKRGDLLARPWEAPRWVGLAEGGESEGAFAPNMRARELSMGILKAPVARTCTVISLSQI